MTSYPNHLEPRFSNSSVDVKRDVHNNAILPDQSSHPHSSSKKSEKKKLQIITFKLPVYQIKELTQLSNMGLFASLSESVRLAIYEFLDYLIIETNDFMNWFILDAQSESFLRELKKRKDESKPDLENVTTKLPINFLTITDLFLFKILEQGNTDKVLENRTDFIRLAVKRFLTKNSQFLADYQETFLWEDSQK